MGIRLLGLLKLAPVQIGTVMVTELSGLAWAEDEQILYAVTDEGAIVHLAPQFRDGNLLSIEIKAAYPLKNSQGQPLTGNWADSEGLVAVDAADGKQGNTLLAVSFERIPRVQLFDPKGWPKHPIKIAAVHADISNFRGSNNAIEALALHPTLGWLTAPERPRRKGNIHYDIRAVDGRWWRLARYGANKSSLVGMEALDDGSLLTLERSFDPLSYTVIIALRRTEALTTLRAGQTLQSSTVALLDSREEVIVDNFEGLTRYRGNRFFMVSDDNQNWFQATLLLHFALENK